MTTPLTQLNLTNPVLAAPMAGGPTTPGLLVGATRCRVHRGAGAAPGHRGRRIVDAH